jgi:ATP-dependent protease ClpP protease subunit
MSSYTIPYVTTRSSNGERTVDIYSRLLADGIIYLGTGIDDGVAAPSSPSSSIWKMTTPIRRSRCTSTPLAGRSRQR